MDGGKFGNERVKTAVLFIHFFRLGAEIALHVDAEIIGGEFCDLTDGDDGADGIHVLGLDIVLGHVALGAHEERHVLLFGGARNRRERNEPAHVETGNRIGENHLAAERDHGINAFFLCFSHMSSFFPLSGKIISFWGHCPDYSNIHSITHICDFYKYITKRKREKNFSRFL